MSRIAYVNGRYVPHGDAAVHIEDRGYQFADGVYEVVTIWNGKLIDEERHLDRLDRSLAELEMASPMDRPALRLILREVVRRNRVHNGMVYMQVSRGVAKRDHPFPKAAQPALVMTARRIPEQKASLVEDGIKVITIADIRWTRRDIKSISLLPNVLGKQEAYENGAYEAWQFTPDGFVTEGTATNAWIIERDGTVVTHPLTHDILGGITRSRLIDLAKSHGIRVDERRFSVDEAKNAREAFLTSSTNYVLPIVQIDNAVIGNGKPGTIATTLRAHYMDYMESAGAS